MGIFVCDDWSSLRGNSLTRSAGVLPARHVDHTEEGLCRDAVLKALDRRVVLEITAGSILVELTDIVDVLKGQFERLVVSEGELVDARLACRTLSGRSTTLWIYDEQSDGGRPAEISEEAAELRYIQSTRLQALLNECRMGNVAAYIRFNELGDWVKTAWVTAVLCAAQGGMPIWCDDVALRALARSIGVPAFSTPSLLDVLVSRGVLSVEERESAVRLMIRSLAGDYPPDLTRLASLVASIGGAASPVASLFSRMAAWSDVRRTMPVWVYLVHQVASTNYGFVADWAHAATIGMTRTKVEGVRREAAALILSSSIQLVAGQVGQVPRCIAAVRSGLAAVRQEGRGDDPLRRSVELLLNAMSMAIGRPAATTFLSGALGELVGSDRGTVLQVLYAA